MSTPDIRKTFLMPLVKRTLLIYALVFSHIVFPYSCVLFEKQPMKQYLVIVVD